MRASNLRIPMYICAIIGLVSLVMGLDGAGWWLLGGAFLGIIEECCEYE